MAGELPPPHPATPAPKRMRRFRRRQRTRKRAPHLTPHPLAKHRLRGHTPAPGAPIEHEKGPP